MRFFRLCAVSALLLLSAACAHRTTDGGSVPPHEVGCPGEYLDHAKTVPSTVFFGYNTSELSPEARGILASQVEYIKKCKHRHSIFVEGHCDERGTREYNLALGDRRATAVKNFLVENGIDANKVTVVSQGKEQPNPNVARKLPGEAGREEYLAANRRSVTVLH
jgi:peptidoglycan-associated lipoprotein